MERNIEHLLEITKQKVRHIDFGASDYQQYKDRVPLKLFAHKNHGTRKRMRNYFNRHSGTLIEVKPLKKRERSQVIIMQTF